MAAKKQHRTKRLSNRQTELDEIHRLETVHSTPLDSDSLKKFSDIPLSTKTQQGLTQHAFVELTDIQRKALPLALAGRDILGAARTGSGKTLAFIIPVLERLYRAQWTQYDGLGAVIIAPTRELALQIFDVLRKVGTKHTLSAGLIMGGKDLQAEQQRLVKMNILVCTPGRLLQHLDQTVGFDCSRLLMLVMDEADRLLDMGFANSLNAILEHLPKERQTLLFSATQTKSVKDLARLSLHQPEYVAVHEQAQYSTPQTLSQHYTVVELPQKCNVLYSFIKTHLSSKIIVFVSSCKQVRFLYESLRQMQPGVPLMALHGKQKQMKRMALFYDFCKKQSAVLFATDIAARGLDFPAVDWVVQLDCPEDAQTYIHRVGRIARYEAKGQALLCLLPSEESGMLQLLQDHKVPIQAIAIDTAKIQSITPQLQAQCAQQPEMKYLAQKAFISYVRSVHLQRHKRVFKVSELPLQDYAESLGLPGAPVIKLGGKALDKNVLNSTKGRSGKKQEQPEKESDVEETHSDSDKDSASKDESENEESSDVSDSSHSSQSNADSKKKVRTRIDRMFQRKNLNVLSEHYNKLREDEDNQSVASDDSSASLFTLKRRDHHLEETEVTATPLPVSRRDLLKSKKRHQLKTAPSATRLVFDDEGEAHPAFSFVSSVPEASLPKEQETYLAEQQAKMKQVDIKDRENQRARLRALRQEKKRKMKQSMLGSEDEQVEVTLGSTVVSEDENETSASEESDASERPVSKRARPTLEDDEALAMQLLRGHH